jgi:hypothetical protein
VNRTLITASPHTTAAGSLRTAPVPHPAPRNDHSVAVPINLPGHEEAAARLPTEPGQKADRPPASIPDHDRSPGQSINRQ